MYHLSVPQDPHSPYRRTSYTAAAPRRWSYTPRYGAISHLLVAGCANAGRMRIRREWTHFCTEQRLLFGYPAVSAAAVQFSHAIGIKHWVLEIFTDDTLVAGSGSNMFPTFIISATSHPNSEIDLSTLPDMLFNPSTHFDLADLCVVPDTTQSA